MKQVRTFHGHEMPLVEVLVEGPTGPRWYVGDLRAWRQHDDGSWTAQVAWTREPGSTFLDIFEAHLVRPYVKQGPVREDGLGPMDV